MEKNVSTLLGLGLIVRSTSAGRPATETRLEIRLKSSGEYVAGFSGGFRSSNGEVRDGMSTDFVRRKELSQGQIDLVVAWLEKKVLACLAESAKFPRSSN